MSRLRAKLEHVRSKQPQQPLSESRPRPVTFTAGGWAVAVLAFVFLAASVPMGVWMYLLAEKERAVHVAFAGDSAVVTAEVMDLRRTRGDNPTYSVRYRFDLDGRIYEGRGRVSRGQWQRLTTGSAIEIVYKRSNPGEHWIKGREPKGMPFWVGPLVGLSLFAVGVFLLMAIRREWGLLTIGRVARAQVTHTKKDQHGHTVYYEFRLLSGAMRPGRYGPVSTAPEAGSMVTIIYDPEDVRRTSRLPLSLVKQQR